MKNRIYIFTAQQLCAHCRKECEEYDGIVPDCDVCAYKELPHTTQNKALARMAKAIGQAITIISPEACQEASTAALNALTGRE